MRPVPSDDRRAVAVLEVFDAVDAKFDPGCHEVVVAEGCINSGVLRCAIELSPAIRWLKAPDQE
jgi:hypothetical protein